MDLSIVIVNFNTSPLLEKCLFNILNKNKRLFENNRCEIIVVDNGSADESVNMVKNKFPFVKLIINNSNFGFGKANNQGIRAARGEYVLLMNSDTFSLDQSIEKMLEFAKMLKKPNFMGGKLLNLDLTPQPSCGPFYSLPVVFAMLFLKGDQKNITRFSPDMIINTDWVSGACLLGKRKDFEKVGLFDEKIFMYMDEVDFLYRAKKKHYEVLFYPQARFIHLGSGSSQSRKEPVLNIYRGLVYFYNKHHPFWKRLLLLFMLKLKALLALSLGYITCNSYLKNTYSKALKIN